MHVEGDLDLADAFALDDVITARAATLDPELSVGRAPVDGRRTPRHRHDVQREVVVYTHTRPDTSMVEVENTRTTVTPEQLRTWCQQAGTKVTVRPVLDLNEETHHRLLRADDRCRRNRPG